MSQEERKRIYSKVEELQNDVDEWLCKYNERRPHSGKFCYGKTPMEAWRDSIHIVIEKKINVSDDSREIVLPDMSEAA